MTALPLCITETTPRSIPKATRWRLLSIVVLCSAALIAGCQGGGGGSEAAGGDNSNGETTPETFSIELTEIPLEGGIATIDDSSPQGGTTVSVSVSPSPGFVFVSWTEDGEVVSDDPSFSFEATRNRSLAANFEPVSDTEKVSLPSDGVVEFVEADGLPAGLLFVSTGEVTFDDGRDGIWRSIDGGENWEKVAQEAADFIRVGPDGSEIVIAGVADGYLLSEDLGETWEFGSIGDPNFGSPIEFQDAVVVPSRGIYLASASALAPGLYLSTNNGATWSRIFSEADVDDTTDARLGRVAASAAEPDVLYIGPTFNSKMQKSVNRGETFFSIQSGLTTSNFLFSEGIRVDPGSADQVFIRENISNNGGANWTTRPGLSAARTVWLDGALLTVDNDTVRISEDLGETWRDILPLVGMEPTAFGTPDRLMLAQDYLYIERSGAADIYRVSLSAIREAR